MEKAKTGNTTMNHVAQAQRDIFKFDQWAEDDDAWDMETGAPGIMLFANAVQVWSIAQQRQYVTLTHCARAFNVPPARIKEAVEAHPFMYVDTVEGMEVIGHEGE